MAYVVRFRPAAERMYDKLPENVRENLKPEIDALEQNPRPYGCKKLVGMEDLYRIRVGKYRIIYMIDEKENNIVFLDVGLRKSIYD